MSKDVVAKFFDKKDALKGFALAVSEDEQLEQFTDPRGDTLVVRVEDENVDKVRKIFKEMDKDCLLRVFDEFSAASSGDGFDVGGLMDMLGSAGEGMNFENLLGGSDKSDGDGF